jgi:hypothetical protein
MSIQDRAQHHIAQVDKEVCAPNSSLISFSAMLLRKRKLVYNATGVLCSCLENFRLRDYIYLRTLGVDSF